MNKSIALIALLMPFSGYAQTKQERKQEIESQIKDLYGQVDHMVKLMENNLFFAACFPSYFSEMAKKIDDRGAELQKELDQINLELK